jgi:carbonic anhydrase
MTIIDTLTQRNATFSTTAFDAKLKMTPSTKTMIVGCVDPRVDPVSVLGLGQGEAVVIRNVGGRVTPDLMATIDMLSVVAATNGGALGPGWNLIVLHHTDCGIKRLHGAPELLSAYFQVSAPELQTLSIDDPRRSVLLDIATLKGRQSVSGAFLITGMVYDIATGRIETVAAPAILRA